MFGGIRKGVGVFVVGIWFLVFIVKNFKGFVMFEIILYIGELFNVCG